MLSGRWLERRPGGVGLSTSRSAKPLRLRSTRLRQDRIGEQPKHGRCHPPVGAARRAPGHPTGRTHCCVGERRVRRFGHQHARVRGFRRTNTEPQWERRGRTWMRRRMAVSSAQRTKAIGAKCVRCGAAISSRGSRPSRRMTCHPAGSVHASQDRWRRRCRSTPSLRLRRSAPCRLRRFDSGRRTRADG